MPGINCTKYGKNNIKTGIKIQCSETESDTLIFRDKKIKQKKNKKSGQQSLLNCLKIIFL